jgi:cyclophilin family peptidyl-prolyl cis-trans isomerase
MGLAEDIRGVADVALATLDDAHDYFTLTKRAWRLEDTPMAHRLSLFALACVAVVATAFAPAPVSKEPKGLSGRFVTMKTSVGTIQIELFADKAPITVKNFLAYVDDKHYDGIVFHRVIPKFMIQGGGYEKGLNKLAAQPGTTPSVKKTRPAIKNESSNGLLNKRGTVAMARTTVSDSATAQFFINVKDNGFLDKSNTSDGYCVFGRVVAGMDVIDKIEAVRTKILVPGFTDVPVDEVVIESVRRGK